MKIHFGCAGLAVNDPDLGNEIWCWGGKRLGQLALNVSFGGHYPSFDLGVQADASDDGWFLKFLFGFAVVELSYYAG